jgi:hypothetical protein
LQEHNALQKGVIESLIEVLPMSTEMSEKLLGENAMLSVETDSLLAENAKLRSDKEKMEQANRDLQMRVAQMEALNQYWMNEATNRLSSGAAESALEDKFDSLGYLRRLGLHPSVLATFLPDDSGDLKEIIRFMYRKLAPKHHPDRGGSMRVMQLLNEAREVLEDPVKRLLYLQGRWRKP